MIKPLSNDIKDGYMRQKQVGVRENNNNHKVNVEIVIDQNQVDKAIKTALDNTMKKYFS